MALDLISPTGTPLSNAPSSSSDLFGNSIPMSFGASNNTDVFGNPLRFQEGMVPVGNFGETQAEQTPFSESFGQLQGAVAPWINAAAAGALGSSPFSGSPSITNTLTGRMSTANISAGVDFTLAEKQNTFGTPEFFGALNQAQQNQAYYRNTSPVQQVSDSANFALNDPYSTYAQRQQAANTLNQIHGYGVRETSSGGSGDWTPAGDPLAAIYATKGSYSPPSYYINQTSVPVSNQPYAPAFFNGGASEFGMNPGDRFFGDGSGNFSSPTTYITTTTHDPAARGYIQSLDDASSQLAYQRYQI